MNSRAPESVHHNDWPVADASLIDTELMTDMDLVIQICGLGRSARNKAGIKLRQPLQEAKVVAEKPMLERLQRFTALITDELNLKDLVLTSQEAELVDHEIMLRADLLGKKYGRRFSELHQAIALVDTEFLLQKLQKGSSVEVPMGDEKITLLPEELEIRLNPKEGYALAEESGVFVGVNTLVTAELKKEGLARDIVRRVQNQRKDADFNIADEIKIYYEAGPEVTDVFTTHEDYIATETLATSIQNAAPPAEAYVAEHKVDGSMVHIGLVRSKSNVSSE
jgi:isoleucyl-tRNA synthetase